MMVMCAWIGSILASLGFGIVIGGSLNGPMMSSKLFPNMYGRHKDGNKNKA